MEEWTYLCGTKGDLEADIIQGFLQEQGIPSVKRYPGFAQVMKVYSGSGSVDLYVRLSDQEAAQELLAPKTEPAVKEELSLPAGLISDEDSDAGRPRVETVGKITIVGLVVLVLVLSLLLKNDFFFSK